MGGPVGGDPDAISTGGAGLARASKNVAARSHGIDQAGSSGVTGAGSSPVSDALRRFVAAYSQFTADVGTELNALATLADNGAADLRAAGGGQAPRRN